MFDEERIPNTKADEYVGDLENFVGSHVYGENIGDLDKMYVAYSYGEQHPLYVWVDKREYNELRPHEGQLTTDLDESAKGLHFYAEELNKDEPPVGDPTKQKKGFWFYNETPYYVKNQRGQIKPNRWTYKHLVDLKPSEKVQARHANYLKKLVADFKRKYKIGDNSHTDLRPGEK